MNQFFFNYEKMATSTTFNASMLRSLLLPNIYIIRHRISFMVKTTDIDNKYDTNILICIIYSWRIWLHYIICTCGWHLLPVHYHINCICRSTHFFNWTFPMPFIIPFHSTLMKRSVSVYPIYFWICIKYNGQNIR